MLSEQKHSTGLIGLPVTKTCITCGESLPLSQFHLRKDNNKYRGECKSCNGSRTLARSNSLSDAQYLYESAKTRAKRKSREFTITIEDVGLVDSDTCPYLQIPMFRRVQVSGKKPCHHNNSKSLDRIDSARGYVPGNIIVCSWRANSLLRDGSLSELKLLIHNFERILNSTKPTEL